MTQDRVFQETAARAGDFEFNAEVADVFDDMVTRSIPLYHEQQLMITEIVKRFWREGTRIYDLGCSTATTLINLRRQIPLAVALVGYDNSVPMLEKAREKISECNLDSVIELREADLNGDLSEVVLDNAGVVTMCWTLQFIRPLQREKLVKWIYDALAPGGVLIVTEKILTNDSHMNRFFVDFYHNFKKRTGYSPEEILRKREALENVLIPYRIDENLELFRCNRFDSVETFFQWYNFAGFLCVKTKE